MRLLGPTTAVLVLLVVSGCTGAAIQERPGGSAATDATPTPQLPETLPDGPWTESGARVAVVDGTMVVNRTGADGNVTYLPERDAVRYVEAWRHSDHDAVENGTGSGREPVYEYMPFEEWGAIECSWAAVESVLTVVEHRTDRPLDGVTAGTGGDGHITVSRQTTVGRDGTVETEPAISLDRLEAITPDEAAVTVSLADRSYACQPSIRVRNATVYQT